MKKYKFKDMADKNKKSAQILTIRVICVLKKLIKTIKTMDTLVALHEKVETLPLNLRNEALTFMEFLIQKSGKNTQKTQRIFGSAKGKIHISDDFDAPLADF